MFATLKHGIFFGADDEESGCMFSDTEQWA